MGFGSFGGPRHPEYPSPNSPEQFVLFFSGLCRLRFLSGIGCRIREKDDGVSSFAISSLTPCSAFEFPPPHIPFLFLGSCVRRSCCSSLLLSLSLYLVLRLRCWETPTPFEFWVSLVFPYRHDQLHLLHRPPGRVQGPRLAPLLPSLLVFALVRLCCVFALFPGGWGPPWFAFLFFSPSFSSLLGWDGVSFSVLFYFFVFLFFSGCRRALQAK